MVVSEWRSRRRNASPTIFDAPPSGSGFLEGRRLRSSCKFRGSREGRAERRHRLDSGAPGRLGRSVCTIMHGDYELSVGFKLVLERRRYRGMTLARWAIRWYTIHEGIHVARAKAVTADVVLPWQ